MLVYVINANGQPLMPTSRCGHVRRLLKEHKAKVIRRCPFTVQLLHQTADIIQPVTLGVDAGSKHIGLSATTEDKVMFEGDVALRNDIVKLMATRREQRRARRNRKTRYRKPRFNNRIFTKRDGWFAPSVRQKIQTHLSVIDKVYKILPISEIVVETASFDIQRIKNPDISGTDYQNGDQLDFWNVREYVLFRDGHTCQCCNGKSKDIVLNVHHIESRKTGGDAPNNLITLCETCHTGYHRGLVKLPKTIRRGMSFKDAAFMGIMRWSLYNMLKEIYPCVHNTYGYITKNTRIQSGLAKEHYVDARCISGHPKAIPLDYVFYMRKVRCHNRQIHKSTVSKGGYRKLNQAPYLVRGFRLFDKVKYEEQVCFITGRRKSGSAVLKTIDYTSVHNGVGFKKLMFLEPRRNMLIERRDVALHD